MNDQVLFPLQFNTGTTVLARTGYDIYLYSALASFTANGVACPVAAGQALNLSAPAKITGNLQNLTTGTIFYCYN